MLHKKISLTLAAFTLFSTLQAQRVGLVLSGGGARGIAHVGLIQALEDNEIPIDYITGTSMGAIVGSMYAMGYSPDQMMELFQSEDFALWQSGKFDKNKINYFKLKDATPSFFTFNTALRDSTKSINFLRSSLVNPAPMNYAFLKLFSPTTVRSEGNFNNLFVPFRAVASDVYAKKAMILREGDLGNAVRASMTIPFMFKPIRINGVLAYDGGIYNNFPVDVMKDDFAPDFIIGSIVSQPLAKPEEGDLMTQIDNIVMQKTNYTIDSIDGMVINHDVQNFGLMDMHLAQQIYDEGYSKGEKYIAEIKERVERRIPKSAIEINRKMYRQQDITITFDSLQITGVTKAQQSYLKRQFDNANKGPLTLEQAEDTYVDLLSDSRLSEIVPSVIEKENGTYDLKLDVKLNQDIRASLGGFISSTNDNRIYIGLEHQLLTRFAVDLNVDAQIGKAYNTVNLRSRFYLPTNYPLYLEARGAFISHRYYQSDNVFSISDEPSFIRQREGYMKFDLGMPLGIIGKMVYGFGYGRLHDTYYQSKEIDFSANDPDKSYYDLLSINANFDIDRISDRDFPTSGFRHEVRTAAVVGREKGNYYVADQDIRQSNKEQRMWLQFRYNVDYYLDLHKSFALGLMGDVVVSNKPYFSNYTASIIQATAFAPTMHSRTVFNSAFRSNNFLAIGVKPIWKINRMFQLRTELYGFQNFQKLVPTATNETKVAPFSFDPEYIMEVAGVAKLNFASISLFVNHYSSPKAEWNFGLNIGFMIDTPRFLK